MFEAFDRDYVAVLTEKAIEFGGGDPNRVVAAAFARFLHQHGIEFDWLPDLTFQVDSRFTIEVRCSTSTDHKIALIGETTAPYTVVARLEKGLVVLQGITFKDQWGRLATRFGADAIPTRQTLSLNEWLGSFPHLWPDPVGEGATNDYRDKVLDRLRPRDDVQGGAGAVDGAAGPRHRADHGELPGKRDPDLRGQLAA